MDSLLRCERCDHGASHHSGSGCEVRACVCARSLQDVIDDGCEAARREIAAQWQRWESSV